MWSPTSHRLSAALNGTKWVLSTFLFNFPVPVFRVGGRRRGGGISAFVGAFSRRILRGNSRRACFYGSPRRTSQMALSDSGVGDTLSAWGDSCSWKCSVKWERKRKWVTTVWRFHSWYALLRRKQHYQGFYRIKKKYAGRQTFLVSWIRIAPPRQLFKISQTVCSDFIRILKNFKASKKLSVNGNLNCICCCSHHKFLIEFWISSGAGS